jgi:hypothetical protein
MADTNIYPDGKYSAVAEWKVNWIRKRLIYLNS